MDKMQKSRPIHETFVIAKNWEVSEQNWLVMEWMKTYNNIDNCGVSAAMELTNIPAIFGVLAAAIELAT